MDNYYFHMDNLSVGYNRKALIHDICIGIKKGEIVTLIGPNGSGKSTILKSIAQKIADKIICVKGDTISHFGKPEEIFEENMIRELYEINNGFFDPLFGSIELPKPEGEAKTFVICGNGTGIPVFRQLQKVHTPFIAGVLYTNDVDYRLARLLADQVITEKPFMEISGETFQKALKAMESCDRVICTSVPVGSCNKRLGELIEAAKKSRKVQFV